jgi:hypothetical protein
MAMPWFFHPRDRIQLQLDPVELGVECDGPLLRILAQGFAFLFFA